MLTAGDSEGAAVNETGAEGTVQARLAAFRELRRELEESVLPIASSIDGRAFTFQASLHGLELEVGGYVVLETGDGPRLGQVLDLALAVAEGAELELPSGGDSSSRTRVPLRHARGEGVVLEGGRAPFHDATVQRATSADVQAWTDRVAPARARLPVGELTLAPGVGLALDAGGFGRHTFMCGQSGSGKTYSLGVMLEQLLLETTLRIVVLDPNSDFVRLGELRAGVAPETARRYRDAVGGLAVHRAHSPGETRLRVRLGELERAVQAAVFRLDPIANLEEHAELDALLDAGAIPSLEELIASPRPELRRLALRARSLGLDRFDIWARADPGTTVEAVAASTGRGVVVDLGSLTTRTEQSLAATAVLDELWRRRERREPVLIVIDEAHNVCPAEPEDGLTALATEQAVRIAAEGRKFGLYLLVSTQRPQKVHPNIVTQCDNLVLMRLNSAADMAYAQTVFSAVPPGLLGRAASFGLGEALLAGKIASHAALLRFAARVAEEGGADVASTWAQVRS
jgi:DNA helicase HerA-like ATPase